MDHVTLNSLSEPELSFIFLSLDFYEDLMRDYSKNSPNASTPRIRENLALNRGFIRSIREKFAQKIHQFTLNEMKIMYAAVVERRDYINNALDAGIANELEHSEAMDILRLCNSIIRNIKGVFRSANIDIDKFISSGGTVGAEIGT